MECHQKLDSPDRCILAYPWNRNGVEDEKDARSGNQSKSCPGSGERGIDGITVGRLVWRASEPAWQKEVGGGILIAPVFSGTLDNGWEQVVKLLRTAQKTGCAKILFIPENHFFLSSPGRTSQT